MSFPLELHLLVPVYIATKKDGGESLVVDKRLAEKSGMRVSYELAGVGRHRFEFSPVPDKACYAGFLQEVSMQDVEDLRRLGAIQEPEHPNTPSNATQQPTQPTS